MPTVTYAWEYTDTFGGEPNYCWVKRGKVAVAERNDNEPLRNVELRIARAAKKAAGLNGVRGTSYWHGDHYEFRPYKCATVLFANYYDGVDDAQT